MTTLPGNLPPPDQKNYLMMFAAPFTWNVILGMSWNLHINCQSAFYEEIPACAGMTGRK